MEKSNISLSIHVSYGNWMYTVPPKVTVPIKSSWMILISTLCQVLTGPLTGTLFIGIFSVGKLPLTMQMLV